MNLTTIFLLAVTRLAAGGSESAIQMANRGAVLFANANYAEAEALYRGALERWPRDAQSARGKAILTGNLGALLRTTGRYDEAEPLLVDASNQLQAMGTAAYADAARILDNLAVLYRLKGDLAKAESSALRAAPMADEAEKPGNRQVLATIYMRQGRYRQAEPLLLVDTESSDARTALTAYLNLSANALMQAGYAQGEAYARHALELAQRTLPANHPAIATALHDLAQACQFEGQYVEAEQRYRQAIAIWEQTVGPHSPDLANGLVGFAGFLHERERDIAAEALYRRSIAILEQVLGKDHPQVLAARIELADVLRAEHRYTESEKLNSATLAAMEKCFQPDDKHIVRALTYRARLLAETKRKPQAEAILKQIAQVSSKTQTLQ